MRNPVWRSAFTAALLLPSGFLRGQSPAPAASSPPLAVYSSTSSERTRTQPPPLQLSPEEYRKAAALLAHTPPTISGTIGSEDLDRDLVLPPAGLSALQAARHFLNTQPPPTMDADGWVTYVYGHSVPIVVLSPLHATVVRLQKGEVVNAEARELRGDSAIKVTPQSFGSGPDQQSTVLLKPENAGTSSDVIITTNKHIYTLVVYVKPDDYTPRVAFTYPDDEERERWEYYQAEQQKQQQAEQQRREQETERQRLAALNTAGPVRNTNYRVKLNGKQARSMRPLAIWDDAVRSFIDLPPDAAAHDLPNPKIYSGKGQDSPNYRYDGSRLMIDGLFDRCELLSGTGRHQQKVVITNLTPLAPETAHARQ